MFSLRQEIRKLIEYPDKRIKPIVYAMVSLGICLGSWDYLQWKYIEPIAKENGEVIAAKLRVYAGDLSNSFFRVKAVCSVFRMSLQFWY
jgi:hypothetical protein